jgi:hypothetical protein
VHRRLGPEALPSACRQFPRVVTLTPLGASVTLSHYCPTAAGLLFRDDVPLAIVSDAPAFPPSWPYDGLAARDALPPLARPGVLMSWPSHARFEAHAVATLAREELTPEAALAVLGATAERLRSWSGRCARSVGAEGSHPPRRPAAPAPGGRGGFRAPAQPLRSVPGPDRLTSGSVTGLTRARWGAW